MTSENNERPSEEEIGDLMQILKDTSRENLIPNMPDMPPSAKGVVDVLTDYVRTLLIRRAVQLTREVKKGARPLSPESILEIHIKDIIENGTGPREEIRVLEKHTMEQIIALMADEKKKGLG